MEEIEERKRILDLTDTSPLRTLLYFTVRGRQKFPEKNFTLEELAELAWKYDPYLTHRRLTKNLRDRKLKEQS